ncbi:hemerythrin domain-containing protein [Ideonella sp. DXS29W]|uniref:Hemerythrin domain-containing protein n=1 Tax=Ideonella lacteola TaxID=2984193 RepID=A0ABU9BKT0_9BURK
MTTDTDTRTAHPRRRATDAPDAVALLWHEHRRFLDQFDTYHRLLQSHAPAPEREYLAAQVCHGLLVHMDLEERLFYPAVARQMRDQTLVGEAVVEHRATRALVTRIRSTRATDPMLDARMKVLAEHFRHHLTEEESELFPVARRRLDVQALGVQLHALRQRLIAPFSPT